MKQNKGRPLMPRDHVPIEREMRNFLAENPLLSDSELKRKVLELRNLPTDPNDPSWKEINNQISTRGKNLPKGKQIESLFRLAFEHIRNNP